MKYFVICPDIKPQDLEIFHSNNIYLGIEVTPIQAPLSNSDLRDQLINEEVITPDNIYHPFNLAFAQTHISLWREAVKTQSPITVFETNVIIHKDFLTHQQKSLSLHEDYDLMIWGYSLNWNPCLELMPGLPKAIYTFPGYGEKEINVTQKNDLIDPVLYTKNDLPCVQTIKALSFSGLGCYTISPKGAKQLLEKIKKIGNEPAPSYQDHPHGSNFYVFKTILERENTSLDIEVNRHIDTLNTYLTLPMLAIIPNDIINMN